MQILFFILKRLFTDDKSSKKKWKKYRHIDHKRSKIILNQKTKGLLLLSIPYENPIEG